MKRLFPERPAYKKERRTVGFPILAAFLLLFLCRLFGDKLPWKLPPLVLTLLLELLVFLLPLLVYVIAKKQPSGVSLRLKMPRAAHLPLLLSAFFTLFCGCLLLSILCGGTDSLGNSFTAFEDAATPDPLLMLAAVGVLAILPAIVEELFFRGLLLAEYERRGVVRALIISTLLFAFIHFDLSNLPVYLFSGFLLSLVLYATDSLFATMLLHALHNTLSLFGQRYLNALYEFTGNVQIFLFIMILVFLIALLFFCRGATKIYASRDRREIKEPRRNVPRVIQLYTLLDAACDPCLILSLVITIAGFILLS